MKLLQDLVPGCNKITGKAGMLDEIINYVQSLQRQVEVRERSLDSKERARERDMTFRIYLTWIAIAQKQFLSMKLAAVSPKSDGTGDTYLGKEVTYIWTGENKHCSENQLML